MRATAACLRKNFLGRSVEELKRLSNIAWNLEGIKGPSGPYALHSFETAESLDECKVMSDQDMGGFSQAKLDWAAASPGDGSPAHARFYGSISTALPPQRPEVQRSGYAGWRTLDRPPTIFGRSLWDIDSYVYLAMRIKSDGRSYFVNVQTDSVVTTDLHQHRLFAKRPGEWETILIKWNDFVRTNHGFVVEPQTEMLKQKVRSIGVGLTDRVPGPFELCIERMWATNMKGDPEVTEEHATTAGESQLRNKEGKNIKWNEK